MERLIDDIQPYLDEIIGSPVSLPWKGYGSEIYLEIGQLTQNKDSRFQHKNGEACIMVSWDWRLEQGQLILFGSSNSSPQIANGLNTLQDTLVQSIEIKGTVPELEVRFSNDLLLRSMLMFNSNPEWSIKALCGKWLYPRNGLIFLGEGTASLSEEEEKSFLMAELAAKRWNVPIDKPQKGNCMNCGFFAAIDGSGYLLDYGICQAENSIFDGRVVNVKSGCPTFVVKNET